MGCNVIPVKFEIKERGATPRKLKAATTQATRVSWEETGLHFHSEMSDARFSHKHASLAGFAKRTKKYESTKLKKFGHTNPLEFSGETRRRVRTANITATSKGVSVRYSVGKLNFRNPKARVPINMADEFRRVTQPEATTLVGVFDRALDRRLAAFQESTSTTVS
jgi:hypothetical protein